CGAVDFGDNIARGYVTVDTVSSCSRFFPDDPGYWVSGIATNQNVLWGDYFYVNSGENFAQGETLVHVEASTLLDITNYTFYYRYSLNDGVPGQDNREGLGNVFAARFLNGGSFDGGTSFLVWRDSKNKITHASCGAVPSNKFPLGQHQVVMFDEEENPEVPEGCTISPCNPGSFDTPFPWEAQRTRVGVDLQTSYDFGWAYMNLNWEVAGTPFSLQPIMQNWVTAVMDASGRFSVGFDAIQLGNVTDLTTAPDYFLPVGGGL
ncbi:MAG: hypothetical protein ABIU84_15765, partial [Thermoanaerobaculia bacterium]